MKKLSFFLVGSLQLLILLGPSKGDIWSNVQNLRKNLLKDYDKNISPHGGTNGTTVIYYSMEIRDISVIEDRQTCIVTSNVIMHWMDKRLKWNSMDYEKEKIIHFENKELWKPDLLVFNSAEGTNIDHFGNSELTVYNFGIVMWAPPAILSVPCTLNLKFWPYDVQKWEIILISESRDGFQVDVQLYNNESEGGMSGKTTDDVEALSNSDPNYSLEWLSVVKVVDRISFILILCIFIISLLCYVAPIH
ncbi:Acetylcholine receptor subunit alpha-type unc-63 [Armadillidium vulgare]|nr:Acetylcholine receptor subunit alpha-type unc-63 [Armadillidium vulgare]